MYASYAFRVFTMKRAYIPHDGISGKWGFAISEPWTWTAAGGSLLQRFQ
jgi:hypothetical protein